jgi:sugar (pentulose or hexulose) kinase
MTPATGELVVAIDFGTTVTKADAWSGDGLVASGRVEIPTSHERDRRVEQDPESWWASASEAVTSLDVDRRAVAAVVFATARQTFAPVSESGRPTGPAIVWSDSRATEDARQLGDPSDWLERTGHHLDGRSVAAKLRWLTRARPRDVAETRWIASPRDLVVARLTGEMVTDTTVASASGCYQLGGDLQEAIDEHRRLFPPVVAPSTVVGTTDAWGLPQGTPVVVGAGDRACEVLGCGAEPAWPMVSWGTTANASLPVDRLPDPPVATANTSRSATGGWLLEWGLAAAGSLLSWLSQLTGRAPDDLAAGAAGCPPGAGGALLLPWLGGARAPSWQPDAQLVVAGLASEHRADDLARAAFEGVGWELLRCLHAIDLDAVEGVRTAGRVTDVWLDVLAGILDRPADVRRSDAAASAGAALIGASALGLGWTVEGINPVVTARQPDPVAVETYRSLTPWADRVASAALAGLFRPT